ncbi:hypothetical protein [Microbacterium sp.]|uniref:hypothetical protein n=1 Tax=Microbacterium sp. TaxID=51671 RepID=UPI002E30412B|nr:hypothetical protein [Microbacterium sp.]HEX5728203.1 hypothetical protein [Microbacterium sp.]
MNPRTVSDRTVREGRAAAVAAAVALRWVDWYSGLVSTEAAERRRAEIESDLWEQRSDARENGGRSSFVAGAIALRVVGGVPDDLLWVRTQRLAMRGQRADGKASAMNSREDSPARWWWVAGAAVLAALYLGFGLDNLYGDYGPLPASAALCFACLAILLAGIACRVKAPRASGALISAGALPLLMAYWAPPLMIAGLAVAVGAMIEVARRSAVGPAARAGAVLGSVLLSFGAIVPILGLGFTPVITPLVAIALGTAAVTAGIVLLLLTRAPAVLPTGHQERPTLAA